MINVSLVTAKVLTIHLGNRETLSRGKQDIARGHRMQVDSGTQVAGLERFISCQGAQVPKSRFES